MIVNRFLIIRLCDCAQVFYCDCAKIFDCVNVHKCLCVYVIVTCSVCEFV